MRFKRTYTEPWTKDRVERIVTLGRHLGYHCLSVEYKIPRISAMAPYKLLVLPLNCSDNFTTIACLVTGYISRNTNYGIQLSKRTRYVTSDLDGLKYDHICNSWLNSNPVKFNFFNTQMKFWEFEIGNWQISPDSGKSTSDSFKVHQPNQLKSCVLIVAFVSCLLNIFCWIDVRVRRRIQARKPKGLE
jgi:hypothetical protein